MNQRAAHSRAMPGRRGPAWAAWAAACLLLGAGAAGAASPAGGPAYAVGTVAVRDVPVTYVAEGAIEAVRQTTIAAQIAGRVVEVLADVGDRRNKGAVLARIDEREASQALAASQAQVAQAQAMLLEARTSYQRSKDLAAQNFISGAALDRAEAEYKAAQANVAALVAGAGQASTVRSFATIGMPYAGVVSERPVEVGDMASPGKPLFTVFDPQALRVSASLPQVQMSRVRSGGQARVEIPSLGRWIDATQVTVLPAADPQSLTTRVRVNLPPDLKDVFPGVYARVHFITGSAKKLVVPAAAVVRRSEVTGVYVVGADGATQFRQVRLGESAGPEAIEVLAGVKAGEQVALEPLKAALASTGAKP